MFFKTKNAQGLREAFGISQERCIELCGLTEKIIEKKRGDVSISDISSEMSRHTHNPAELAFVNIHLGMHVEQARSPISFITSMMRSMSKPKMHPFSES